MNATHLPEPTFDALYRDLILDHYKAPHGRRPLEREDVRTEGVNPLCGDEVDLALQIGAGGRIEGILVDGRGCAISVASGSILHDLVQGATLAEASRFLASVRAALHGEPVPPEPDLGDFEALEGVRQFPVRIKCALLPWTTLEEALAELAKRHQVSKIERSGGGGDGEGRAGDGRSSDGGAG